VAAFVEALAVELGLRADALDATSGAEATAAGERLSRRRDASLLPAETCLPLLDLIRRRFGIAAAAEVTLEANPGPEERGDPRALRAAA
jgi:hypothetical protein